MNAMAPASEIRDWIAEHLDPLHDHAIEGGQRRSDFDLTPGGWSDMAIDQLTPAAVLIGLIERDHGLSVLLTRRADTLRRHTGQVALPGGRQDPGETPWETALREAQEEVNLDPKFVTLAGLLHGYRTVTGFHVTPVVGFIDPAATFEASPDEVADVFETPFAFLMDPGNHQRQHRDLPDGERRFFYAMPWNERFIWGATAGMLRALYERLHGEEAAA